MRWQEKAQHGYWERHRGWGDEGMKERLGMIGSDQGREGYKRDAATKSRFSLRVCCLLAMCVSSLSHFVVLCLVWRSIVVFVTVFHFLLCLLCLCGFYTGSCFVSLVV